MQSLFWIGLTALSMVADQDELRAKYNDQVARDRSAAIAASEKELEALRKSIRSAPEEERPAIRMNIALHTQILANYKDPKYAPTPWLNMSRPREGRIGEIPEDAILVVQVADDGELLCKIAGRTKDVYFWLSEYPTRGTVDGQTIKPEGLFEVIGTKRYTATGGASNTVWHLKPFPLKLQQK